MSEPIHQANAAYDRESQARSRIESRAYEIFDDYIYDLVEGDLASTLNDIKDNGTRLDALSQVCREFYHVKEIDPKVLAKRDRLAGTIGRMILAYLEQDLLELAFIRAEKEVE